MFWQAETWTVLLSFPAQAFPARCPTLRLQAPQFPWLPALICRPRSITRIAEIPWNCRLARLIPVCSPCRLRVAIAHTGSSFGLALRTVRFQRKEHARIHALLA